MITEPNNYSVTTSMPVARLLLFQEMHHQQLLAPPTHHAAPLAQMWQDTTQGWLDNRQRAVLEDIGSGNRKKLVAESKILHCNNVTVIMWAKVCSIC